MQSIPPEKVIRVPWQKVDTLVKGAINDGSIDRMTMNETLRERLNL